MKLTVLGTCSPYPLPGRACPSYLLEAGGRTLLLDCGSGAASRLLEYTDYDRLAAVVLSHLHGDHMSDLWVIRYAVDAYLRSGRRQGPLPVYAPPEPAAEFALLPYREAFKVIPAVPGGPPVELAGTREPGGEGGRRGDGPDGGERISLSFFRTDHPLPCNALVVQDGGQKFAYSADTSYSPEMAAFVAGADLFLCEATLQESVKEFRRTGHLTASDAGRLAREAGAKRLVLTHFSPGLDVSVTEMEAEASFGGRVELARERSVYTL